MAEFLFAPMPFTGHVNPALPIVRELTERGHGVRFYTTSRFRKVVEAAGARWVPLRHALPLDEERLTEMFPERPAGGIQQIKHDLKHVFIDFTRGALRDLMDELRRRPADVIVGDNCSAVVEAVHQKLGIPWALYGISVMTLSSRDTAPFGLALPPASGVFGRLRNRALYWLVENVIFRDAKLHNDALRRELGLPSMSESIFDFGRKADLYLQSGVPSFDYPRTDLPPNVRFTGAAIPEVPEGWTTPSWWIELHRKRVVLVTQGTINNDFEGLIRPAIRALANEDVFVVVTTGSRAPAEVGIDPLPSNVKVERFVPYAALMPHVDVLLTNGGYGSVQITLANGVPVVAIGNSEEKPEIANRIAFCGVGIGLKVAVPTERQIATSVRRVLHTRSYAARAAAMQSELAKLNAGYDGADFLEELAGGAAPLEASA